MKRLTIAIALMLSSLFVHHALAQNSSENTGVEQADNKSATVKINLNSSQDEDKNVVIKLDGENMEELEGRIDKAVEKFADVFGDSLAAEFSIELDELSDEEKERIEDKLEELFADDHLSLGFHDDGMGAGEVLIALTAVSFTLGLPVIILLLVLIFRQRKRKQMLELADVYMKADRPMPEHVMAEFGSGMSSETRLKKGIFFTIVGIALTIVLWAMDDLATATLGLIPVAIGISRLVFWKIEDDRKRESGTQSSELMNSSDQISD